MEPIQIAIVFAIITLTSVVSVLSIQTWYILKEFRHTIQKINKILDDTGSMTGNMSETVEGATQALSGLKGIVSIISAFRRKGDNT